MRYTLLFLLFTIPGAIFSREFHDINFSHLTTNEGLTQNTITSIAQDSEGFIWIGTEDGLNRFDGKNIVQFRNIPDDTTSIIGNYIEKIIADHNNRLWITLSKQPKNKVVVYDKSKGFMPALEYLNFTDTGGWVCTNVIVDSRNRYWVSLTKDYKNVKILLIDNDGRLVFDENHYLTGVFEDSKQNIWLKSINKVVKIDTLLNLQEYSDTLLGRVTIVNESKEGVLWFTTENNIYSFINEQFNPVFPTATKIIHCPYFDSNGRIWGGIGMDTIFKVEHTVIKKYPVTRTKYFNSILVRGIHEDNKGNIWISTFGEGVFIFDAKGVQYRYLQENSTSVKGLSDDIILCSLKDSDGNIWLGSYEGGCQIYKPKSKVIKTIDVEEFFDYPVRCIYEDENENIWVGAREGGLFKYNPASKEVIRYLKGYHIEFIFQNTATEFYLGTRFNGVIKFNLLNKVYRKIDFEIHKSSNRGQNYVRKIIKDKQGELWFSTWWGLINYNTQNKKFKHIDFANHKDAALLRYQFDILQETDTSFWLGTEAGLILINRNGKLIKQYKNIPSDSTSIGNNIVFRIYRDSGKKLWIGTFGGGLNLFNPETETFTAFRKQSGLPNDCIFSITEDSDKNLWLSTNYGLSCFMADESRFKNFFREDGLTANSFHFGASVITKKGMIYYGTERGVNYLNPGELIQPEIPRVPVITDFKVYDSHKDFRHLQNCNELILAPNEKIFSFSFVSPEFHKPDKLKYYYRIKELHKQWIFAGNNLTAIFSNLPHGNYHFEVKSVFSKWEGSNITSVPFKVKPPFYKTIVFYVLLSSLVLGLLYYIYWNKIRHLKNIEKVRMKIAQDLHDEIGSNLGSISIMAGLISKENTENVKRKEFSLKIGELSKRTADSMRDIIWFIDPGNDSADRILLRMREFLNRTLINQEVDFSVEKNSFTNQLHLNMKRNIYLIFKEAVNNIAKHAVATKVNIRIFRIENSLKLTIIDNGKGFNTKVLTSGMGLQGMNKRAKNINGEIEVLSNFGTGTKITLSVLL